MGYKQKSGPLQKAGYDKDATTPFRLEEPPKSINEAQYKMLKDKFIMSSRGPASISGVTGRPVDVKKSFATFDKVYGEDTEAKVKAVQDLYSGLAERSKGEVKEGLGPYKPLFN